MKAHLFAISLLGINAGAARHHDVADLEARQLNLASAAVSVCYTFQSTYLTLVTPVPSTTNGAPTVTVTPTGTVTTQPTTTPAFTPVILGIVVTGATARKRDLEKRVGLGGFVSDSTIDPNPRGCSAATIFQLQVGGGLFLDQGQPLFYTSGTLFSAFRSTGPPPQGAVTTFFNTDSSGFLSWVNTAFLSGAVSFCQVPATGQVFATFGTQTQVPATCVTVRLQVFAASRCQNDTIDGNTSTSSGVVVPTTNSVVTPTNPVVTPTATSQFTFFPNGTTTRSASTTDQVTLSSITNQPSPSASGSTTDTGSVSSSVTDQPSPSASASSASSVPTTGASTDVFSTSSTAAATDSGSSTASSATATDSSSSSSDTGSSTASSATATDSSSSSSDSGSSTASSAFSTPTDFTSSTSSSGTDTTPTSTSSIDSSSSNTDFVTTSSAASSSASNIVITSTSTETIIVVTSSSASSQATASATSGLCPFSTSGSIITNGGFENPNFNPFTYAISAPNPLSKKRAEHQNVRAEHQNIKRVNLHTNNIVSSSFAPVPYFGLCNYILQLSYVGGTTPHEDAFEVILLALFPGQVYNLRFDTLACGSSDSFWAVQFNDITVASGVNAACGAGGTAQWQTYFASITATGVLDTLYLRVTGNVGLSTNYFDNFVLTTPGTTSPTSSSAAPQVT